MKTLPVEAELFHLDGVQTGMMKLKVNFRNFAKAPKHGQPSASILNSPRVYIYHHH